MIVQAVRSIANKPRHDNGKTIALLRQQQLHQFESKDDNDETKRSKLTKDSLQRKAYGLAWKTLNIVKSNDEVPINQYQQR